MGIILALAGVIINIIAERQNKLCTQHTEGIVIQYGFPGDGRMYPIVEYFVDGVCYKAKKKFRGVKRIRISGFPIKVQSKAYEDEKGWLHIKIGPIANLHQIAEQLWPIGSKMTVFYNPNDPKKMLCRQTNFRKLYIHNVRLSGNGNNNSQCIGILFDTVIICKS